ncbi:hypothetical protein CL634_05170 [bacterium]|nr:hypothetical protein [bacterium]|tara:strand:+ start:570 stop:917 length:348 start_codon:yes stop_codon:yes gene_type:complete
MFELFFISSIIVLILLTWFESDAFIEYAELIGGAKFFGIEEFKEMQSTRASLDYHGYLLEKENTFFIRLITCPLCFSFWASLITTYVVTDSLLLFPMCNILALIVYKLTSKVLSS